VASWEGGGQDEDRQDNRRRKAKPNANAKKRWNKCRAAGRGKRLLEHRKFFS